MSDLSAASQSLIVRKLGAMRTLTARTICAASTCFVLLGYCACGDDSAANTQEPADASTRSSAQPVAVQKDASSMAFAAALEPPLACGASDCVRPKNIAAGLLRTVTGLPMTGAETVACCLDETQGICSSAASVGASCDMVAISDNRCPGVDLSALADLVGGLVDSTRDAMIGCCTHGACGLDGKLFGRGCVENADAKRMLGAVPVIGPLITVPPPRLCEWAAAANHANNDHDAGN